MNLLHILNDYSPQLNFLPYFSPLHLFEYFRQMILFIFVKNQIPLEGRNIQYFCI